MLPYILTIFKILYIKKKLRKCNDHYEKQMYLELRLNKQHEAENLHSEGFW